MANHGEWVGNLGYCAFATETTPGTAVTPTVFSLLDSETMTTAYNLEDQMPIAGFPTETYQVTAGLRSHKGDIEVVGEPDTAIQLVDMMMTRGSTQVIYTFTITSGNATIGATYTNNTQTFTVLTTIAAQTVLVASGTGAPAASGTLTKATGTGDATITFSAAAAGQNIWPFTINGTTAPKSKTIDISTGNIVKRFVGVQASKFTPVISKNQINLKVSVSALGSFQGGVILSQSGSGPFTINFDPTYDTTPTAKLVVGDLVRFYDLGTSAAVCDGVVASIVSATSITMTLGTGSMAAIGAGDIMYLRPQTPSFTLLNPLLWSNSQFCFGTTAAAALAAAQTRVEPGSAWEADYSFENDNGSPRSGNADPASLPRTVSKVALTIKKFFDTPEDVVTFNQTSKTACVIRHFAYAGVGEVTSYELRITINHLVTDDPLPKIKARDINYENIKYHTQYDSTDGQQFDIKVINNLASIG